MIVPPAHPYLNGHLFFATLKFILFAVAAPFVLIIFLLAFVAALADFAWFRLRTALSGGPHAKDVWEF
ncbi:MAG: hypothetical protein WBY53_10080 [Acidobacteriaceae bacterium]